MNRIFYLLVIGIILLSSCSQESLLEPKVDQPNSPPMTNRVSLNEALKHADRLLDRIQGKKTRGRLIESVEIMSTGTKTRSTSLDTAYYIVNYANNGGFAILGADRRLDPIYAVSDEGHLNIEDTAYNSGLKMYFDALECSALAIGDSIGIPIDPGIDIDPSVDPGHGEKYVAPLLTPAVRKWGRSGYFSSKNIGKNNDHYSLTSSQVAVGMICTYYHLPEYYEYEDIDSSVRYLIFDWDFINIAENFDIVAAQIPELLAIIGKVNNLNSLSDYERNNENFEERYQNTFEHLGFRRPGELRTFTSTLGKDWIENYYSPLLMVGSNKTSSKEKTLWIIDGFLNDWYPGFVDNNGNPTYGGDGLLFHCVWGDYGNNNGYYKYDGKLTPFFNHYEVEDDTSNPSVRTYYNIRFCGDFEKYK